METELGDPFPHGDQVAVRVHDDRGDVDEFFRVGFEDLAAKESAHAADGKGIDALGEDGDAVA